MISKDVTFYPEWISAPGETIKALMHDKGLSLFELATHINNTIDQTKSLLDGDLAISEDTANALSHILGSTPSFWLQRDKHYREDLVRNQAENNHEKLKAWVSNMPIAEMIRNGWIKSAGDLSEKAKNCLKFYDTETLQDWQQRYGSVLNATAFRASDKFETDNMAVLAWLRQGEIIASRHPTDTWNPKSFASSLMEIRQLTRIKDPNDFIPKIRSICAKSGVSVAFVKSLKGSRASGASRFLPNGKPIIMLSFRYLTDDHFWFTFFHEAAHLILHADTPLHIEGSGITGAHEEEANNYAAQILIPADLQEEFLNINTDKKSIIRFGVRAKVAAGIIVGQLQHIGHLCPTKLNWLKKRYKWSQIKLS